MFQRPANCTKTYRSRCGRHYFVFDFRSRGSHIDIHCRRRPSLNGRDSNVHKTHLYRSGLICFHDGYEPRTQSRAEELAAQWAEYFCEYRKTGIPQS